MQILGNGLMSLFSMAPESLEFLLAISRAVPAVQRSELIVWFHVWPGIKCLHMLIG